MITALNTLVFLEIIIIWMQQAEIPTNSMQFAITNPLLC